MLAWVIFLYFSDCRKVGIDACLLGSFFFTGFLTDLSPNYITSVESDGGTKNRFSSAATTFSDVCNTYQFPWSGSRYTSKAVICIQAGTRSSAATIAFRAIEGVV